MISIHMLKICKDSSKNPQERSSGLASIMRFFLIYENNNKKKILSVSKRQAIIKLMEKKDRDKR